MKILGENENRDLFLGSNNQLVVYTEIQATLQACRSVIESQRGELQFDILRGIPTEEVIWSGVPNQQRFQFFCITALRAIEGVNEISQFNTEIIDNSLRYEAKIVTIYGEATIGEFIRGV